MIGETVGSYRITRILGRGGMGHVYLAEHTLIGRRAAVKVLTPYSAGDPDVLTRFFAEAKVAAVVKHPGIVDVFDYGRLPSGAAYIVMDYLEGRSLAARIEAGPIPMGLLVEIARQAAIALGAAHGAGVIHRDLKPENIFLISCDDNAWGLRVKILDFGLAKVTDADGSSPTRTGVGIVVGTAIYMSPEQCQGDQVLDGRSDLYSLGCVMYEMACGAPPFFYDSAIDAIRSHLTTVPEPPSARVPEIPPEVERVIMRLLEKEPGLRYESAAELRAALDGLGGGLPVVREAVEPALARRPAVTANFWGSPPRPTIGRAPPARSPAGNAAPPSTRPALPAAGHAPRPRRRRQLREGLLAGAVTLLLGAAGFFLVRGLYPQAQAPAGPAASPTARILVRSSPPGATVLRDGREVGRTPFELRTPRADGTHSLTLRLPGHHDADLLLDLGSDREITARLRPLVDGGGADAP